MILGMSAATYTLVHVLISLIGIGSGVVVLYGMIERKRLDGITAIFLTTTVLTSVTGYGFPTEHILPSQIIGAISLIVLTVAILARYSFHLSGSWRKIYVITAAIALYLNVFVLVVQSFLKVPNLNALAPTQKEPPFLLAQLVVMLIFIILTAFAVKRFREEPTRLERRRAA